jgi:hypothetical protein
MLPTSPTDLLQLQVTCDQVSEELLGIPLRPWTDAAGNEHRTGTGWRPEHDQQEQRLLETITAIDAHPYWAAVTGKVVDERARLKRRPAPHGTPGTAGKPPPRRNPAPAGCQVAGRLSPGAFYGSSANALRCE